MTGDAVPAGSRLAEIPESEAVGSVAATYADIRLVLGLPIVNLVYRHLASRTGLLESVWSALRPNLISAAAEAGAADLTGLAGLPALAPVPGAALAAAGVTHGQAALARATLDAYARANSHNILGMHALLDGCAGTGKGADAVEPPPPEPILPMADLGTVTPAASLLLDAMSLALVGSEKPRIVPGLLRHFAHDECLLAVVWTALRPPVASGAVAERATAVGDRARVLAGGLPYRVERLLEEEVRVVASRFIDAMATMLVFGEALRTALAEAPGPPWA